MAVPGRRHEAPELPETRTMHPKVTLVTKPVRTTFVAGETLEGVLELTCSSEKCALGEIGLELTGREELSSLDHIALNVFLRRATVFQSVQLPSNAVDPAKPVGAGAAFWLARRGRTRFPFAFALPSEAPSSCRFGRDNAAVRYELRATAWIVYEGERTLLARTFDVLVLERWSDIESGDWWTRSSKAEATDKPGRGGTGALRIEAELGPPAIFWRADVEEGDQRYLGHDEICVRLMVRNASTKSASGVKLILCRRLDLLHPHEPAQKHATPLAPSVVETIDEQPFRGPDVDFAAQSERYVELRTTVPRAAWTVRKTQLFEIRLFIRIFVDVGLLGFVAGVVDIADRDSKEIALELPITIAHPLSIAHAADRIAHYIEPPATPMPQWPIGDGYTPTLPPTPSPYLPQPSPDIGYMQTCSVQPQADGCLAFDPRSPELTASTFAHPRFQSPSPRPLPIPYERGPPSPRPMTPPDRPPSATYDGPSATPSSHEHRGLQLASECAQLAANMAPRPAYSGLDRGGVDSVALRASRRSSMPNDPSHAPSPAPPPIIRSSSTSSLLHRGTPSPPIAPSAHFRAQSPEVQHDPLRVPALDTIGEDGESQAGSMPRSRSAGVAMTSLKTIARALKLGLADPGLPPAATTGTDKSDANRLEDLVQLSEDAREKTLPAPPVPTLSSRPVKTPHVAQLFSPPPPQPPREQPSPILPPMSPTPSEGLMALERRLLSRPSLGAMRSPSVPPPEIAPTSPKPNAPSTPPPPTAAAVAVIRREAVDRVADWLSNSPAKPSAPVAVLEPTPSPAKTPRRQSMPAPETKQLKPVKASPARRQSAGDAKEDGEPTDGPRYDVKSARGGRGGIVSAVAAQWSGLIAQTDVAAEKPLLKPKAIRPAAKPAPLKRADVRDLHENMVSAAATPKPRSAAPLAPAPAKTSAPAVSGPTSMPADDTSAKEEAEAAAARKAPSAPLYHNATLARPSFAPPTVLMRKPKPIRPGGPLALFDAPVDRPPGGAPTGPHGAGHARLAALVARFDKAGAAA